LNNYRDGKEFDGVPCRTVTIVKDNSGIYVPMTKELYDKLSREMMDGMRNHCLLPECIGWKDGVKI
jgi:hypothetical protein